MGDPASDVIFYAFRGNTRDLTNHPGLFNTSVYAGFRPIGMHYK